RVPPRLPADDVGDPQGDRRVGCAGAPPRGARAQGIGGELRRAETGGRGAKARADRARREPGRGGEGLRGARSRSGGVPARGVEGDRIMKTVLVVDDDRVTRHLLKSILEREGFVVATAGDGEKALGG